jgi:ATP-binding cassette subfamily B protein
MWELRRFLVPYRRQAILGASFKFVEVICELLLPSLMAVIVDSGVRNRDARFVTIHGIIMIGIATLGFSSALVCQYFAARAAQGYDERICARVYLNESPSFHTISKMRLARRR